MKQGRHRYGEQKGELVLGVDEAGASSLRGNLVADLSPKIRPEQKPEQKGDLCSGR
jgi:hypothetical protein